MGVTYIENPGPNVMFVGGKLIPPGEGRHIDVAETAPELGDAQPAAVADEGPTLAEQVAELLKGNVATVKAALGELTGEALDLVVTIENSDSTPRKSLLDAVAAEQLRRANARLEEEQAQAEFEASVEAAYQAQLAELTPEQLEALGEAEHNALRAQAVLDVQAEKDGAQG